MIIYTDIIAINQQLQGFKGGRVQVWMFNVTHKKIAIRVSHKSQDAVLYIIGDSCEYMSGGFSWLNADIHIEILEKEYVNYKIADYAANFELLCSGGVALINGTDKDFNKSFFEN